MSLAACRLFDNSCLTLLSACSPNITMLDLGLNPIIDSTSINDLAIGCGETLVTLILSSCTSLSNILGVRIDDRCVDVLSKFCVKLKCLDISSNAAITDKSLVSIGKMPCIREVSAARCQRVSGVGVGNLVRKRGKALRFLDISYCNAVSHDTVARIRMSFPGLRLNAKLEF